MSTMFLFSLPFIAAVYPDCAQVGGGGLGVPGGIGLAVLSLVSIFNRPALRLM